MSLENIPFIEMPKESVEDEESVPLPSDVFGSESSPNPILFQFPSFFPRFTLQENVKMDWGADHGLDSVDATGFSIR